VTLSALLTRAQISRYEQWLWFRGCSLEKTVILVPDDPALAASLTRCWLPQIRQVLPLCTIRVGTPTVTPPTLVRTVYSGKVTAPAPGKLDY
jgi:hypothetical protein